MRPDRESGQRNSPISSGTHHFFTNQLLALASFLKKSSSRLATFWPPAFDGCTPSCPRSLRSHTSLSPLRGVTPSAQRYGPQRRIGPSTLPFSSLANCAWITQRTENAVS